MNTPPPRPPIDPTTCSLGELIRFYRMSREVPWDQRKLAAAVGCSQPYISQLESGRRGIEDEDILFRIHEALQLSEEQLDDLLTRRRLDTEARLRRRLARQKARVPTEPGDVIPGVSVEALRKLLLSDETARSVVLSLLSNPSPKRADMRSSGRATKDRRHRRSSGGPR